VKALPGMMQADAANPADPADPSDPAKRPSKENQKTEFDPVI